MRPISLWRRLIALLPECHDGLRQWARMKQLFLLPVLNALAVFNAELWAQGVNPVPPPAPHSVPAPPESGLETPDEARAIVMRVLKTDDQLKPLLAALNPKVWYETKGAPSSYVPQWQAAQQQLADVDVVAKQFLQHIDRLTAAMDLYFRLEALEFSTRALNEGAQRYAERPAAEQLAAFVTQNFESRQRFREYLQDLANNVEQNYKTADEEAQRCRAMVNSQSSPCGSATSKKHGKS